jgi:hypothetical protein
MLRHLRVPTDVPHDGPAARRHARDHRGAEARARQRHAHVLAWLAGLWQLLHHAQMAVLILFATRELGLSAGAIGLVYVFGGAGCVLAAATAERLAARFGVGPMIVHGLTATAIAWQLYGLVAGPAWVAMVALGLAMLLFDFGGVMFGIQYLSLRQAITPDRLLGRMTATMRFLTVAAAPLGSLAGGAPRPRSGCVRRC